MSAAVRQSQKQLAVLQKQGENRWCVECKAASPQWASPKYGIFICLECAGVHRSLGVHLSFVRSATMDQFKPEELKLMEIGGNDRALKYFRENGIDESVSIVDKYNSTVAEDYREMLAAEVKGETWTRRDRPVYIPKTDDVRGEKSKQRSIASNNESNAVKQFQKPSAEEPTLNEIASDAFGAISSGWGWFSKTVTQKVTETTDTYIRPGMRQFAESEMGGNARRAVEQFGRKAREAGVYGAEQFNKYAVEALGNENPNGKSNSEFSHLFDDWTPRTQQEEAKETESIEGAAAASNGASETASEAKNKPVAEKEAGINVDTAAETTSETQHKSPAKAQFKAGGPTKSFVESETSSKKND